MLNHGCKEPLLSPNCIKIGNDGQIVVGEWEFTHFYEGGMDRDNTESNFIEEGETFLQPIFHDPNSSRNIQADP